MTLDERVTNLESTNANSTRSTWLKNAGGTTNITVNVRAGQ